MPKIFDHFSEIREEVKAIVPPVVYKYRDWGNKYHQSILTENNLWLAHPKDLNDPYDIRVPVRFDFTEVDHPLFFERLKYHTTFRFPNIPAGSREFEVITENQFDIIREDPKTYFETNYLAIRESELYDRVGVLSLSSNPENETMWAHYGNNGLGFCVGFDTVGVAEAVNSGFGLVEYSDEPPVHSFIVPMDINTKNEMYLKHSKWVYEKEFRIVTLQIRSDKDRIIQFDPALIKEVLLGYKTPEEHKGEIITLLRDKYQGKVKLFQTSASTSSYGLEKKEINYA